MKMVTAAKGGTAHEPAQGNPMGYAAATSKPKVEKKGAIERVSMESKENGWTVRVSYKDKPMKGGSGGLRRTEGVRLQRHCRRGRVCE